MDYCVLRLQSVEHVEWLLVNGQGEPVSRCQHGTLSEASAAAAGHRALVLVPAGDVTLAEPDVPVKSGRLMAALPYALEESIAGDVEDMHFAVGRPVGTKVPTAVVDGALMQRWLNTLAQAGITPRALYAESMVVPANPGHTVVVCQGDEILVRPIGGFALSLEADPLGPSLRLAGLPPALDAPSCHVLVYAGQADWERHQGEFEVLKSHVGSLTVQLLADGALPLLAAGAINDPPFSLLQGAYTVRGDYSEQWQRWRLAGALSAALVVLHLATLVLGMWHVQAEEKKLDQQMLTLLHQTLPELSHPAVTSARALVESRVRSMGSAGHTGMLGALSAVSTALAASPDLKITALSYHDGTTDLTVDAPAVGTIDQFQKAISSQGFAALMQSTTQHETRYQGHVQIKGAG